MKEGYIDRVSPKGRFKNALGLLSMVLFLFVFTAVSTLAAQPDSTENHSPVKDRTGASVIALSGTVFPFIVGLDADFPANLIMMSGGLVLGPVLGHVYMDHARLGFRYAGTRALILGGTIGSVGLICALGDCSMGLFSDDSGSEFGLAIAISLVGLTATLIHNLNDTFTVGKRVENRGRQLTVTPMYFPEQQASGIRVMRRF